jgi:hypothetical protein
MPASFSPLSFHLLYFFLPFSFLQKMKDHEILNAVAAGESLDWEFKSAKGGFPPHRDIRDGKFDLRFSPPTWARSSRPARIGPRKGRKLRRKSAVG